jgi:hypothetical protein
MRCAIAAYTNARKSLRSGDNPELLAAALNNRAFAHAVMAMVERKPELRLLVRRELRAAAHASREKNLFKVEFRAPKIAKLNLEMLVRKNRARHMRGAGKGNHVARPEKVKKGNRKPRPHKVKGEKRQKAADEIQ